MLLGLTEIIKPSVWIRGGFCWVSDPHLPLRLSLSGPGSSAALGDDRAGVSLALVPVQQDPVCVEVFVRWVSLSSLSWSPAAVRSGRR